MKKRRTRMDAQRFLVVDCETTGLDTEKDRILSIALLPVVHSSILLEEAKEWIIQQENPSLSQSAPVHGIMPEIISGGNTEEEVIREIIEFGKDAVWTGHHVEFDLAMIRNACQRVLGREFKPEHLDTGELYLRLEHPAGHRPVPGLDELAGKLGISPVRRHTAGGDALTTSLIFIKLLAKAKKKGITSFKSLKRKGGNPFFRF